MYLSLGWAKVPNTDKHYFIKFCNRSIEENKGYHYRVNFRIALVQSFWRKLKKSKKKTKFKLWFISIRHVPTSNANTAPLLSIIFEYISIEKNKGFNFSINFSVALVQVFGENRKKPKKWWWSKLLIYQYPTCSDFKCTFSSFITRNIF